MVKKAASKEIANPLFTAYIEVAMKTEYEFVFCVNRVVRKVIQFHMYQRNILRIVLIHFLEIFLIS